MGRQAMAGPDKDEALIPGGGSAEEIDDDRLAESEGVEAEHKEGDSEAADNDEGKESGFDKELTGDHDDRSGNQEDADKKERCIGDELGDFVTFDDHIQIVHVGRSFRMAALLMLFLALAVAVRAPSAWVFGVGAIAFYPVSAALFYFLFRGSGPRSGPPDDTGAASLALFWASAALLLSDITVLGGLLLAALAVLLCGISTGERLALVAVKRKTGLRGAIRAAWRLDRRARERAWADLVGER